MLQKIDHWIIDHFFQVIVDWGNKHLGVTKSSFLVASFSLLALGQLFFTYVEITAGYISPISLIVLGLFIFFGPNFIAYVVRKVEREEKGGFAPRSRTNSFDTVLRIMYLFLTITEINEVFFTGEVDVRESTGLITFMSIWFIFGFLACKNNPPMFKKKVPPPA